MLLGDPGIEEAIRERLLELAQRCPGRHCRGDTDDLLIGLPERDQGFSEYVLIPRRGRRCSLNLGCDDSGDRMGTLAVLIGWIVAAALLGHDMEEDRTVDLARAAQCFDYGADVVAVDWSHIRKAELFPDHRVVDELLEGVLPALAELD